MNNKHFIDWESNVFGYGYGTGEEYTLKALKDFLDNCVLEGIYQYEGLEKVLTPTVCWLMINILCHANIIEYGTSPRYGWLSEKGKELMMFVRNKTVDELYEMTNVDSDYVHCYPDHCNCNVSCDNPMFKKP